MEKKSTGNKKNRKVKWVKFRHKVVWTTLKPFMDLYCRVKYGARIKTFKAYDREMGNAGEHKIAGRPCVILYNHVTGFDQFFLALSCRTPVYYVATEDIFSMGFASKLIKYLVNPIPIKKHTTDIKALKTVLNVAREGGIIAIAPEGNRTYSGRTCEMKDSISSLCKKLKLPIVLLKIDGGYGVQPRWSNEVRKGHFDCGVSKVIYPEEYKDMPDTELFEVIKEGLYLDEARATAKFKSKRRAEFLERAIYVCPDCGLSSFESNGNEIKCLKCSRRVTYREDTSLEGVDKPFPYKFVADWYDYQKQFVNSLNTMEMVTEPLYTDVVDLYEVIPYKKKELLSEDVNMQLFGDRITFSFDSLELKFAEVTGMACMGKNKLNVEAGGKLYQVKGNKRFNALKYVNFCYRFMNLYKGDKDEQFLGL